MPAAGRGCLRAVGRAAAQARRRTPRVQAACASASARPPRTRPARREVERIAGCVLPQLLDGDLAERWVRRARERAWCRPGRGPDSATFSTRPRTADHRCQSGCRCGGSGWLATATRIWSPAELVSSQVSASTDSGSDHCRLSSRSRIGRVAASSSIRVVELLCGGRGTTRAGRRRRPTGANVSNALRSVSLPSAARMWKSLARSVSSSSSAVLPVPTSPSTTSTAGPASVARSSTSSKA